MIKKLHNLCNYNVIDMSFLFAIAENNEQFKQ